MAPNVVFYRANAMNIDDALLRAAGEVGCGTIDRDSTDVALIVSRLSETTQQDRSLLSKQLGALKRILDTEALFQRRLFPKHIKIPVSSNEMASQVAADLFKMGCGLFNGRYPLVQDLDFGTGPFIGVQASPTGALGFWLRGDEAEFSKSAAVSIAADDVILCQGSLSRLVAKVIEAGPQAAYEENAPRAVQPQGRGAEPVTDRP